MKVAWVGLGKLGGPCALALAAAGHHVAGHDVDPRVADVFEAGVWPHDEPGVDALIVDTQDRFRFHDHLGSAVVDADVVFVAVQTPHGVGYGGDVPMPAEPAPFDTATLVEAVSDIHAALTHAGNDAPIVVVSTVLPGTCRRELRPVVGHRTLIYSPAFVAMGSVLRDLAHPEFILAGVSHPDDAALLAAVHGETDSPTLVTSIESAELAKMAYNTAITAKVILANALGELAGEVDADVDEVTNVLAHATDRVVSARYLNAGLGDGGPCHPRDGIAMAWLAEQSGLSADPFGFAVRAREAQAERLAALVTSHADLWKLPVVICGRAYKEGVSIEAGSAALLVGHYVETSGHHITWVTQGGEPLDRPAVVLIALPDRAPSSYADGSVIIDPWGRVEQPAGNVMLLRPGRD